LRHQQHKKDEDGLAKRNMKFGCKKQQVVKKIEVTDFMPDKTMFQEGESKTDTATYSDVNSAQKNYCNKHIILETAPKLKC
jgi:hypothetical protein